MKKAKIPHREILGRMERGDMKKCELIIANCLHSIESATENLKESERIRVFNGVLLEIKRRGY